MILMMIPTCGQVIELDDSASWLELSVDKPLASVQLCLVCFPIAFSVCCFVNCRWGFFKVNSSPHPNVCMDLSLLDLEF